MPEPKVGVIPAVRLADARRVRDLLRVRLQRFRGFTATLMVVDDGFAVLIRYPPDAAGFKPAVVEFDGVPVRLAPKAAS